MTLVAVERAFETTQQLGELQAKLRAAAWCFEAQRVRFRQTFFARDGRRMICIYEASDVESVRTTQRTAGLPVEHAWAATPIVDTAVEPPSGYVLAVVQRALPEGITIEQVQHLATDPTGCGKRLRLVHFGAFLALDLRRMVCAYYTPDLESVRVANRETGTPIEALWSGELFRAPG